MTDLDHFDSAGAGFEPLRGRSNFCVAGGRWMVNKMKDVNKVKDVETYICLIIEFSFNLFGDQDNPVLVYLKINSEQPKAFPNVMLPA
jgi:hypothetical protein